MTAAAAEMKACPVCGGTFPAEAGACPVDEVALVARARGEHLVGALLARFARS